MAISSVSGAAQLITQQVNPRLANPLKDADSNKGGTKAGQVEKAGESGKASETLKAQAKPTKPNAPTPPPAGNIENRKPPAEPLSPTGSSGRNVNTFA